MADISSYLAAILDAIYGEEVRGSIHDAIQAINDDTEEAIAEARSMVGTPVAVTSASDMSDTSKIYIYKGSEADYVNGDWYYYNGNAWTDGGPYGRRNAENLLLTEIPGTTQEVVRSGDKIIGINHKSGGVTIRSDSFEFGETTIVETRTLNTGETMTLTTNLITLETVIS